MADQIKKIIFTTKEAYDQKAAAGTLDPSVVYAIDASQSVTVVEVKEAVDTGFSEFGLNLGLDREAVKFYKIPIGLTLMLTVVLKLFKMVLTMVSLNLNYDQRFHLDICLVITLL